MAWTICADSSLSSVFSSVGSSGSGPFCICASVFVYCVRLCRFFKKGIVNKMLNDTTMQKPKIALKG